MSARRRLFRLPWRTRNRILADFDEELALHLDLRAEELLAAGHSPAEARAIARGELGDVDDARRYVEALDTASEAAGRRREALADLGRDVLQALRRLRRAPLFALTASITLALGIAACTLMFSIVNGVLLTPPPVYDPERVYLVWGYYPQVDLGFAEQPLNGIHFATLREETRAFSAVAAFRSRAYNLGEGAVPERLDGAEVSADFFRATGVDPRLGRFFVRGDEVPGADHVVVLGNGLWRRRFAADPGIVGRSIQLNGDPYVVIGVAPSGFAFPRGAELPNGFQFPAETELWVPVAPPQRGPSDLAGVARVKPGVSLTAATEDMTRITGIVERLIPAGKGWFGARMIPLRQQLTGGVAPLLVLLLAAVGLVLCVACVNTAQLFLARLQARRRELAVRAALGASGRRLATELVIEAVVLAGVAGAAGTALGAAGVVLVRTYGWSRVPRLAELSFDGRSAAAALGATLLAALLASLLPALAGRRVAVAEVLRQGGRGTTGRGLSSRARHALVVAELALSVVLVAGAGLLIRSLAHQLGSATGFSAPNGITFEITLPPAQYPERQFTTYMEHPKAVPFFAEALRRIRAIPGVQAAAIGKPLPLSGAQESSAFTAEGVPTETIGADGAGTSPVMAEYTIASEQMFRALGTPLREGRDFSPDDREDTQPVAIVNQAMARRLWPGQSAIGRRIRLGGPTTAAQWMTVVGVAADIKRYSLTEIPRPEMIVPYTQRPYPTFTAMQLVVRSTLGPAELLPAVRRAVAEVDPGVPVSKVRTIEELVGETTAQARFATRFMAGFGAASLLLAMIGLYGVIAYGVHQRRQEFGVRRALGASQAGIVRLVVLEGWHLAVAGLVLGLLGALAAGRLLEHLLYQVSPLDPVTLVGTATLLGAAATLASVLPAARASRVEPRVALED
jgi:predicted permease